MKKLGIVMIGVALFVMCTSMLMLTSAASTQNANSSTTTNKNDSRQVVPPDAAKSQAQPDFSKNTWELPADADKTKNPIATSAESVAKGKELYLARDKGNCTFCHGESGAGNESNTRMRRKPADISDKERMDSMTDGEVFWKISKGIQGIMPAGEKRLSEEERWHLVNYVRTLSTAPAKP